MIKLKTMGNYEHLLTAKEDVFPYLMQFKECYQSAIEKYFIALNSYKGLWTKRAKAIIFQNIIINEIKTSFNGMENIYIAEKYESISLVINSYVSARFKKFNEKGLPSNHTSKRNNAIISQQLELGYKDYPPFAFIDVGYTLDITGSQFDLLKVICRKNNDIIWDLYFHDIDNQAEDTNTIFPITPVEPAAGNKKTRIKINHEHKKAE